MIAKYRVFSIAEKVPVPNPGWFDPNEVLKYNNKCEVRDDVAKFLTEIGQARVIAVNSIDSECTFFNVVVWYWDGE